jgi:hypothetical protein
VINATRLWATLTVLAATLAVVIELVLVIMGLSAVTGDDVPPLRIRLWRFVSFFTIQSTLLVIITVLPLIMEPSHDGRRWRVLRLDGLVMITVTGLVHWFLLRPLSTLTGWSVVADTLLHIVVPLSVVVGWLVFGPRPRIVANTVAWSLLWPVCWVLYTFAVGSLTGWYRYPFLDVSLEGVGPVALTCGALTLLFAGLASACWRLDRALSARPRSLRKVSS